jgi:hypothetical protein
MSKGLIFVNMPIKRFIWGSTPKPKKKTSRKGHIPVLKPDSRVNIRLPIAVGFTASRQTVRARPQTKKN